MEVQFTDIVDKHLTLRKVIVYVKNVNKKFQILCHNNITKWTKMSVAESENLKKYLKTVKPASRRVPRPAGSYLFDRRLALVFLASILVKVNSLGGM